MEQNSGAAGARTRTTAGIAHLSVEDLELYYLGMFPEGPKLDAFEEHLLACPRCLDLAEASDGYVDTIRAGIVRGSINRI